MTDRLTPTRRSWLMSRVKSQNTSPELIVRPTLHALDYRYRLHDKGLPGTPDLVFRKRRKVIFVHGCYWHGHSCRQGKSQSKSNIDFWQDKLLKNMERDVRVEAALKSAGWSILIIWGCEIKSGRWIEEAVRFLDSESAR